MVVRHAKRVEDGGANCKIEGVSTNDLMSVRGWTHPRSNKRIGALDSQLGTSESQHILSGDKMCEKCTGNERVPIHDGVDFKKRRSERCDVKLSISNSRPKQEGTGAIL